jgi:hypothetical protein
MLSFSVTITLRRILTYLDCSFKKVKSRHNICL